jgi:2,3-diketo-5-methylthio-1-phosphopentane phosphatase
MKRLVLCDFDGTISLRDTGYLLVRRFCPGDWEAIDREFRQSRIGSREAYSRIAEILRGDEQSVLDFIRNHSEIDPHFIPFYEYCRQNDIDLKIVSDGLDFYIRSILAIHHLSGIPFYANATRFSKEGLEISFPFVNEECGLCGTCKRKLVRDHRKEYDSILFIGNGVSDRCAAEEADFAFAKDSLYTYCIKRDIACQSFGDFREILRDLEKRT